MSTVSSQNSLSYLGVTAPNPPTVVATTRAPTIPGVRGMDVNFPIGTIWVNTTAGTAYILTSIVALTPTWDQIGSGATVIATINGQAPIAGNFNMLGTANQITVTPALGQDTFTIPAAFIAPGSIASTTTLTGGTGITATTGNIVASTGNITSTLGSISAATSVTAGTTVTATLGAITATNGNLVLGTAGNKIVSTSVASTTVAGANSFGTVTLVGGTATVGTTAITANSIVQLTRQSIGATGAAGIGHISRGVINPGVSFIINALDEADGTALVATDVSSIGWMIIN